VKDQLDAQPVASTKWPVHPLGKVAKFLGGGTPSKSRPEFWNGDIPWVSPKDMKSDIVSDSLDKITPQAVASSAAKVIPVHSLLIVVRSGILARTVPTALSGRELTINQDLKAICPSRDLHPRFLAYFMRAAEREVLATVSRGATVHRLSTDVLKSLEIPLPPLEEQKRIVAVLDRAFAALDRARDHAEANLADATHLYERKREVFLQTPGSGWKQTTVGNVCQRFEYGTSAKSNPDGRVPVLRMGNLQGGEIDWTNLVYTDDEDDIERLLLKPGDVLFNRTNSADHVGKTAIFRENRTAIFAGYLIRLHLKIQLVDSEFINVFLNSDAARKYGRSIMGKSVNQANISASKLKEYPLLLPPLDEQRRIVSILGELRQNVGDLSRKYAMAIADIADLRQSILQKAFSGQLT